MRRIITILTVLSTLFLIACGTETVELSESGNGIEDIATRIIIAHEQGHFLGD